MTMTLETIVDFVPMMSIPAPPKFRSSTPVILLPVAVDVSVRPEAVTPAAAPLSVRRLLPAKINVLVIAGSGEVRLIVVGVRIVIAVL